MIIYQADKRQFLHHALRDDIEDVVGRRRLGPRGPSFMGGATHFAASAIRGEARDENGEEPADAFPVLRRIPPSGESRLLRDVLRVPRIRDKHGG